MPVYSYSGSGLGRGLSSLASVIAEAPYQREQARYQRELARKAGIESAMKEKQLVSQDLMQTMMRDNPNWHSDPELFGEYAALGVPMMADDPTAPWKYMAGAYGADPRMSQGMTMAAPPGAVPTGGVAPRDNPYADMMVAAATRNRLDPDLFQRVAQVESNYNPSAVSPKGAAGLYQFMEDTWNEWGQGDRMDPAASTDAGARYLRWLLDQFNGDYRSALAAYNWGIGNVKKQGLANMPAETRAYLARLGLQDPEAAAALSQAGAGPSDPRLDRMVYATGLQSAPQTFSGMREGLANDRYVEGMRQGGEMDRLRYTRGTLDATDIEKQRMSDNAEMDRKAFELLNDQANVPKDNVRIDRNGNVIYRNTGAEADIGAGIPGMEGYSPYEGTGLPQQHRNVLNRVRNMVESGVEVPRALQNQYDEAYLATFGPKREIRENPSGQREVVVIQPDVPPGMPPLFNQRGSFRVDTPDQGGAMSQGTLPQMMAPGAAMAGSAGGTPMEPPGGYSGAGVSVQPIGPEPPLRTTESDTRGLNLQSQYVSGIQDAMKFFGFDPKTRRMTGKGYEPGFANALYRLTQTGGPMSQWFGNVAVGGADEQEYQRIAMKVIEPLLRLRSGAATPDQEVDRYQMYLPVAGQDPAVAERKMQDLLELQNQAVDFARLKGWPVDKLFAALSESEESGAKLRAEFKREGFGLPEDNMAPATEPAAEPAAGSSVNWNKWDQQFGVGGE